MDVWSSGEGEGAFERGFVALKKRTVISYDVDLLGYAESGSLCAYSFEV